MDEIPALTVRELVMELRNDVQELRKDFALFKMNVVTKDELKSSRRYMITTVITIIGVGATTIAVVLGVT